MSLAVALLLVAALVEAMEAIPKIRRPRAKHTTDQIVAQARQLGWTVGITMDDLIGAQCGAVIGLHPQDEDWLSGKRMAGVWFKTLEDATATVQTGDKASHDTRTIELHSIQGLAHAVGMLIAYIPKEKIVVQADLYNPQAAAPNASNRTFQQNLQRLKLDVATIVGIHGNPAPMPQFVQLMSKAQ